MEGASSARVPQLSCWLVGTTRGRRVAGSGRAPLEEPQRMILAGDIGGTSTRLAYFEVGKGRLGVVAERTYHSREQATLESAVKKFIIEQNIRADVACFGIAGPVRDRKVETPNLPW